MALAFIVINPSFCHLRIIPPACKPIGGNLIIPIPKERNQIGKIVLWPSRDVCVALSVVSPGIPV
jgi:hypothetical protein